MKIVIESDGYPSDEELERLRLAKPKQGQSEIAFAEEVLVALMEAFERTGYGTAARSKNEFSFATGGWSGCEDLIGHLPMMVQALTWKSSHRGGRHVYELAL